MSRLRLQLHAALLRGWRDLPLPRLVRRGVLRALNPSFLVGAVALIEDDAGRVLLFEHTYRRERPWGLPGGWIRRSEDPVAGLIRELREEAALELEVTGVAAVHVHGGEVNLLYRGWLSGGVFRPSAEVCAHGWFERASLPPMPEHHLRLLDLAAGEIPSRAR